MYRMIRVFLMSLMAGVMMTSGALAAGQSKEEAETFVSSNATLVLNTLDDPALSAADRTAKFNNYMQQFADMRRVSAFVLGKYRRTFSKEQFDRYFQAFNAYGLAVYETQLDEYRGREIVILNAQERKPGDWIISSKIKGRQGEDDFSVKWRVVNLKDRATGKRSLKVVDVEAFDIWLALEQKAQFESILDRARGNPEVLITRIDEMTADLKAQQAAEG